MAILHTQGKWTKSNPATTNKRIFTIHAGKLLIAKTCDHLDRFNNSLITPEQAQANAALICDAVNNTANKGIDPNAVPGLLEALKEAKDLLHTLRVESLYRAHNQRKKQMDKIEQAIKSADLK